MTLQDLATISEVCAGFKNIIVTGLVSCLINASEYMQNASLRRKFFLISGEGQTLIRLSPIGECIPLPKPHQCLWHLDTRTFSARLRLDKFRKSNPVCYDHHWCPCRGMRLLSLHYSRPITTTVLSVMYYYGNLKLHLSRFGWRTKYSVRRVYPSSRQKITPRL